MLEKICILTANQNVCMWSETLLSVLFKNMVFKASKIQNSCKSGIKLAKLLPVFHYNIDI